MINACQLPFNRSVVFSRAEFVVMATDSTRAELLHEVTQNLAGAGIQGAESTARFLVSELLDCPSAHLVAFGDQSVEATLVHRVRAAAARCARHEPVQYVTGWGYFRDLRLKVSPEVLIPRPETEQLVTLVLEQLVDRPSPSVLDVGTGSGCIALAIKQACPNAQVTGCDISIEALAIARSNAKSSGLDITLEKMDITDQANIRRLGRRSYDVIVSNPPYIPGTERDTLPPEIRDHEPAQALFCGDDPLKFYRALLGVAQSGALSQGGLLAVETHADWAKAVGVLFSSAGIQPATIYRDFAGHQRFVLAGGIKQAKSKSKGAHPPTA